MPTNRMNREEFLAKLAGLDEERLRKALWNLYWRGAAPVRERIEAEIAPAPPGPRARPRDEVPDPVRVREEVREFVALARAGSYLAGDRRVSPKERTRWRFTFRRLADEAQAALAAPDSRPAEEAMEALVDPACYNTSPQYGVKLSGARDVLLDGLPARCDSGPLRRRRQRADRHWRKRLHGRRQHLCGGP